MKNKKLLFIVNVNWFFPSHRLPIALEAMACGCPVICSNSTSLPEVGGDSVIYISGQSHLELAQKLNEICQNTILCEDLRESGLKRVKQFPWKTCAQQTLDIYAKNLAR